MHREALPCPIAAGSENIVHSDVKTVLKVMKFKYLDIDKENGFL